MQDRIYCSEQITIPQSLPEIIKEYSKTVLHEQPTDLVEFSIKYFTQLSALAPNEVQQHSFVPDLRLASGIYKDLQKGVALQDVVMTYKIPPPVNKSIVTLSQLANLECDALVYVILLLSLSSPSMPRVLDSVINVISPSSNGAIKCSLLLQVFDILGKFDPRVETDLIAAARSWVKSIISFEGEDPQVTFTMLSKAGLLSE